MENKDSLFEHLQTVTQVTIQSGAFTGHGKLGSLLLSSQL